MVERIEYFNKSFSTLANNSNRNEANFKNLTFIISFDLSISQMLLFPLLNKWILPLKDIVEINATVEIFVNTKSKDETTKS